MTFQSNTINEALNGREYDSTPHNVTWPQTETITIDGVRYPAYNLKTFWTEILPPTYSTTTINSLRLKITKVYN